MTSNKQTAELGLGENEDFLDRDNQMFINKLNYICKNYDNSFKDVSRGLSTVGWKVSEFL